MRPLDNERLERLQRLIYTPNPGDEATADDIREYQELQARIVAVHPLPSIRILQ